MDGLLEAKGGFVLGVFSQVLERGCVRRFDYSESSKPFCARSITRPDRALLVRLQTSVKYEPLSIELRLTSGVLEIGQLPSSSDVEAQLCPDRSPISW
jgi:hypothetical protein